MEKSQHRKITRITNPADLLSSKDPEIIELVKDNSFITINPNTGEATLAPANILPSDYSEQRVECREKFAAGDMSRVDYEIALSEIDDAEAADADAVIEMKQWIEET